MVRACSAVREARAKVSSSTKTAFFKRSLWRDSRFEDISVRFAIAPPHLSLPFPFSSIADSLQLLSSRESRHREKKRQRHHVRYIVTASVWTNWARHGPITHGPERHQTRAYYQEQHTNPKHAILIRSLAACLLTFLLIVSPLPRIDILTLVDNLDPFNIKGKIHSYRLKLINMDKELSVQYLYLEYTIPSSNLPTS